MPCSRISPNPQQLPSNNQDVRVYYQADLPVSFPGGQRGSYRVVVTSPSGMGQVEAATATSDAIRRWHPSYVLLVGIAGGDPEETALGDVLIAEQVHYSSRRLPMTAHRFATKRIEPILACISTRNTSWTGKQRPRSATRTGNPKQSQRSGRKRRQSAGQDRCAQAVSTRLAQARRG